MDKVPSKNTLTAPKLRPIARRRRNYVYLLLTILLSIALMYVVKNLPPSSIIPVMEFGIPILPIFFLLIAGFIYTLLTFIFIQKTQGILVSFFVILYLILRLLGLTHWGFGIIIFALFIVSEIIILRKK